ncbi:MAG: metal-dependent hydrolase [Flavobacteriales bacterium]|nr:metal-dependent hydrolase [Flavobacteriales bacterium]
MKITYYGHSCFGITTKTSSLLFDPFIRPNELAKKIEVDKIPCDYMLISHGHEDHVADALEIAKRTNSRIVSNFEIVSWFEKQGINQIHPMNIGGEWNFDFGSVRMVNAVHSSVLPDGSYGGNPGGFLLNIEGKQIYYAGDTALHMDMKLIAELWKPDIAFLPIGDNFTMGINDARIASDFIDCNEIIGMHYDTFPYIVIDREKAKQTFKKSNKKLTLINIGDSINF